MKSDFFLLISKGHCTTKHWQSFNLQICLFILHLHCHSLCKLSIPTCKLNSKSENKGYRKSPAPKCVPKWVNQCAKLLEFESHAWRPLDKAKQTKGAERERDRSFTTLLQAGAQCALPPLRFSIWLVRHKVCHRTINACETPLWRRRRGLLGISAERQWKFTDTALTKPLYNATF